MRLHVAGLVAGLACCASACVSLTPQVRTERELLEADRAFSALSARAGMAAAFTAYIDPRDGALIQPGVFAEGAGPLAAALAGAGPDLMLVWEPDRALASLAGDLGVTTGRFTRTVNGAVDGRGRYVSVWRRDAAGAWKVVMEIGNTDPPGTPVPAPAASPAPAPAPRPAPIAPPPATASRGEPQPLTPPPSAPSSTPQTGTVGREPVF